MGATTLHEPLHAGQVPALSLSTSTFDARPRVLASGIATARETNVSGWHVSVNGSREDKAYNNIGNGNAHNAAMDLAIAVLDIQFATKSLELVP